MTDTERPWLKLSSAAYCPEGLDAMFKAVEPGQLRPEHWQLDAELALARSLGVDSSWVVLTGSGTAALTIAHHFLGDRGKMTVEAPVMTWPSSYSYARHAELRDVAVQSPHFVNWTSRPDRVRVPVALWGVPVPASILLDCHSKGPVVYDCCHAFGYGLGELAQGHVDALVYSFGPTKEVPCVRGGAVISPHVTPAWRAFRDSGTQGRYMVIPNGGNFEISEPYAALLTCQLRAAGGLHERRLEVMRAYDDAIADQPCGIRIHTTAEASGHLYVVQFASEKERNIRVGRLNDARIECGIHYPLPLWLAPIRYPGALELSSTILSLPCHTHMTPDDARRVVTTMEKL